MTDTKNYAGLTITHIIERDGFGGDELEADVDAYCEAVADTIADLYPGAIVTCEAGLSRRTEIGGALADTFDGLEVDEIRTACRESASAVWEAGEFWTDTAREVQTSITCGDIVDLSVEAGAAGDEEQVAQCCAALAGDTDAWTACERAINEARAAG